MSSLMDQHPHQPPPHQTPQPQVLGSPFVPRDESSPGSGYIGDRSRSDIDPFSPLSGIDRPVDTEVVEYQRPQSLKHMSDEGI
jgi:hypothetical protein